MKDRIIPMTGDNMRGNVVKEVLRMIKTTWSQYEKDMVCSIDLEITYDEVQLSGGELIEDKETYNQYDGMVIMLKLWPFDMIPPSSYHDNIKHKVVELLHSGAEEVGVPIEKCIFTSGVSTQIITLIIKRDIITNFNI